MPEVVESSPIPTLTPVHALLHQAKSAKEDMDSYSMHRIVPLAVRYPGKAKLEEIEVISSSCIFDHVDDAVGAAVEAQAKYHHMPISVRKMIVEKMRKTARLFKEDFAWCAWSETGRGRYQDKVAKQGVAADATPGVEDLVPRTRTGDYGLTTVDFAPFGVFCAIAPTTNPTATVINNCITLLSGGNGVVFNAHPAAMRSTNRAVAVMNQAVVEAGGPPNVVVAIRVPTIESGGLLMKHPLISANLVTGGPAVVKVALSTGKRSFCAGPGNPPTVVDETADIEVAAKCIYSGASFDNNMICSDEKEVFVVDKVAGELESRLVGQGAFKLSSEQLEKLMPILIPEGRESGKHGMVNRDLVGMDASVIAAQIGLNVEPSCRLLIAEVPADHPLVWTEQLMPVLPIVRCAGFEEAVAMAKRVEYNYKHSASIYSQNLNHITAMASIMNTALFIINGAHTAGLAVNGEGYTSFSIAGTTGEGMTRPSTFVRERRMVCCNALHFV